MSWRESDVIDDCGTPEQQAAARDLDRESSWEALVDDPTWRHEGGGGSFCFLDPIGFRYYIAAAVVRCARLGYGEQIGYALEIDGEFTRKKVSLLTMGQNRAIARFVRFMIATHAAEGDEIYGASWKAAYQKHWKQFDGDVQAGGAEMSRSHGVEVGAILPKTIPMDEVTPHRILLEEYVNRREYLRVTMKDATQLTFLPAGVSCAAQSDGNALWVAFGLAYDWTAREESYATLILRDIAQLELCTAQPQR